MSYACPKCGSEHTRKFSIVCSSGTSGLDTASLGMTSGGAIGAGITTGTKQSVLAKKCAPPEKLPLVGSTIFFLVVGGISSIFWGSVAFYIAVGIAVLVLIGAISHNQTEYPKAFAAWDAKFLCTRCEHAFAPSGE